MNVHLWAIIEAANYMAVAIVTIVMIMVYVRIWMITSVVVAPAIMTPAVTLPTIVPMIVLIVLIIFVIFTIVIIVVHMLWPVVVRPRLFTPFIIIIGCIFFVSFVHTVKVAGIRSPGSRASTNGCFHIAWG